MWLLVMDLSQKIQETFVDFKVPSAKHAWYLDVLQCVQNFETADCNSAKSVV